MARKPQTRTFHSWRSMKKRCLNPNDTMYYLYGARGVKVCERWSGKFSFKNFLSDMGERPAGKSLDRIDPSGDYSPANCRWATPKEQSSNRRDNIMIDMDGERLCLAEWCRRKGLVFTTIWIRIVRKGLSPAEALTKPVGRWVR